MHRGLCRPPSCPICGAPYTSCTTFHTTTTGALSAPVTMPRTLRARLVAAAATKTKPPAESITSPPFTTATYERAKHNPRTLARRGRKKTL